MRNDTTQPKFEDLISKLETALEVAKSLRLSEAPPVAASSLESSGPRYVRIKRFAQMSGYTVGAVQAKIYNGTWIEGHQYRRAPDGNICVDVENYERWVEGHFSIGALTVSHPAKAMPPSASTKTKRRPRSIQDFPTLVLPTNR